MKCNQKQTSSDLHILEIYVSIIEQIYINFENINILFFKTKFIYILFQHFKWLQVKVKLFANEN